MSTSPGGSGEDPVGIRSWRDWSVAVRVVTTVADGVDEAVALCGGEMSTIGAAVNRFDPESELCQLTGRTSGGVQVSATFAALLTAALDAAAETRGLVDPTLGDDLRRLGYTVDMGSIGATVGAGSADTTGTTGLTGATSLAGAPSSVSASSEIDAPRLRSSRSWSWNDVHLHGRSLQMPDDLALDLGATAKAFAADRIAALIVSQIGGGVLVSLGGDIATCGAAPAGGWRVLVQDGPDQPASMVVMHGSAGLATSSTLHRVWMHDGTQMNHILDPATGRSVEPWWRTVSVAAPSCLRANTWSTAAMVLGRAAVEDLEALPFGSRLIAANGEVSDLNAWGTR